MSITSRITSAFNGDSDTSEESFEGSATQEFRNYLVGKLSLREGEFLTDVYGEDISDPHTEMRESFKMFASDPMVATAVKTRTDTIIGRELSVETDDDTTQEFFDQEVIPELKPKLRTAIEHMSITGNGYIEVLRAKQTGMPVSFEEVNRPHKVYLQFGEGFEVENYIIESYGMNEGSTHDVAYYGGRTKQVRGTAIDSDNIIHLREGSSVIPKYGRSVFCSAIDDQKVKQEMLRSLAVVAKQKSIPRKLYKVNSGQDSAGIDEPIDVISPDEKQQIESKLNSMDQYSNPVLYNTNIETEDLSYDPRFGEMQSTITELQRGATSSLPSFAMNGEETNRATAAEEKALFYLRTDAVRDQIRAAVDPVLQEIAEEKNLDTNVSIKFGDYDFPTREENLKETRELWNSGIITLNQARTRLGMDDVDDEIGDAFKFELDTGGNPFDQMNFSGGE